MPSRMERYYKQTGVESNKRSQKNEGLYRNIYDGGEYSNIEGIARIEKTNEVDINKIKLMLKNREEQANQKANRLNNLEEIKTQILEEFESIDDKNYDIRDILNKAKISNPVKNEHHNLSDTNFNILKDLHDKRKIDSAKENSIYTDDELKDLINTITSTSVLNKMGDKELSLNFFEDLKSNNNTVIENRDSIKALLEEAKENERKKFEKPAELDKSFFTSSLNFGKDDFEELANLNKNIKKNNWLMKILLGVILIALIIVIIILIFK